MADAALDSLRTTLNRIVKQSHHPRLNREIISIHDIAAVLQLDLKNITESLEERIREAANTTENIIQYLVSEKNPLYGGGEKPSVEFVYQLREVAQKFKSSTAGDAGSSPTATTIKDVVVGLDTDLEEIKNRLIDYHRPELQFVSIFGRGGAGKTTLAKLVYNDELIVNHFDFRGWIVLSQDYSLGSILANLLVSLGGKIPIERGGRREIRMESLICTYLEQVRYLIVVDDTCSKKAWDDLKTLFPNTNSGSRIILTTRLFGVAAYADSSYSNIHMIRLLNAHHSWVLLTQKVFADESCPFELVDVGRRIVQQCGGLPLSVVVMAGILSKLPRTLHSWKQIPATDGNLETIISSSYNHLPDYLRMCLSYMGAGFPEDYEIRASQLIKLWIAEGFLNSTGSKSLEEEAQDCLEDLVQRSLVLVRSGKFDGKTKSCSLHDIVRDFCVKQAVRDKFFLSVVDFLPSPILRRHFLPRLLKDYGRLSVTWHDLHLKDSVHASSTKSIICIPQRGYRPVGSVGECSSLRIFHVLDGNDHWYCWEPDQLFDLIHLTYLASTLLTRKVPPTISKLHHLQTLIIYKLDVVLPVEIWSLRQLRHLIAFSFSSLPHPDGVTHEELQKISLVRDYVCSGRMVEMIPNIKKLGLCYSKEVFHESYLDNLQHLCQLEKLKLKLELEWEPKLEFELVRSMSLNKLNHVFPLSLKKLTLCGLGLPWGDMTIIGSLPNLQVLKLRYYACIGYCWKTIEGEFGKLRLLLIENCFVQDWITESSHFPKLECLILDCGYSFEIPSQIGDFPTLKLIEVDSNNLISAKRIEQKQRLRGNANFQVRVKKHSPFYPYSCRVW